LDKRASTKVTSHVDPEYRSEKYNRPVIFASISPLSDKKLLENSFVNELKLNNIDAYPGTEVFSPTRELTEEYIVSALKNTDADSVLIVTMTSVSDDLRIQFETKVLGNKLHTVWIGSAETKLQAGGISNDSTMEIIFNSVAEKIVQQLMIDGVIE